MTSPAAIAQAVSLAAAGDVIVVAGKGHETGQYVAGAVLPFDDRQVTATALRRAAQGNLAPGRPVRREPGDGELGQPPLDVALQTWAVNR
jgi:hypothetical protein